MSDQSSYDALVRSYSDATYESARLRMFSDLVSDLKAANAEIERLREGEKRADAEIERLRSLCDSLADDVDRLLVQRDLSNAAIREAEEWRKEVERLRREYEKTWADAALKDADIERLQTARQRGARP